MSKEKKIHATPEETKEEITEECSEATSEEKPKVTSEDVKEEKEKGKKDIKRELELANKRNEELRKELDAQTEAAKAANEKFLRLAAEYDNFRKRAAKEKDSIYPDAIADAVSKLLPVLDNLERAAQFEGKTDEAVGEGISKIEKQFIEILEKLGITEIPTKDVPFNPELHNAVMHEDNEELGESVITEVFMKGYKMGERVVRHSVVKVAN